MPEGVKSSVGSHGTGVTNGCELGTEARSSGRAAVLLAAESPLHLTYSPRVLTVAAVVPGLPETSETSCSAPSVRLTVLPALTFQQGSAGLCVDPLAFKLSR